MGRIKDLTGQKFGKLIVLEITPERRNRQVVWKCLCECGNITYVVGQALRTGHTQTCGCGNHTSKNVKDILGQRFGKLVVLARSDKKTNSRNVYWDCRCDCGKIESIQGTFLNTGKYQACSECRKQERLTHPTHNHIGERYGLLTVIEPTETRIAGKVVWKCQCDCGNMCEVSSNALVSGNTMSCGCLRKTSVGEALIEQYLKLNNIAFTKQFNFIDCISEKNARLLFDFAIFNKTGDLKCLIEYDGVQHYHPVDFFGGQEAFEYLQKCDCIKNDFCKNNNIKLYRIKYTDKQGIDKIVADILKECDL